MKIAQMLEQGAREIGIELNSIQVEQFLVYVAELKKWNEKINLTAIVEDEKIVSDHFLDSLSCLLSESIGSFSKVVDLGAGAGFPGIPLKLALPSLRLTLIDSSKKKTAFLEHLIKKLDLAEVEVVAKRVEDGARMAEYRERFDIAVARAVSALPVIIEYGLPFLKIRGKLIAQKGRKDTDELNRAEKTLPILGGRIEKIQRVDVPFVEGERHLVIISKELTTPARFPRRVGVAQKRPLA